jgi:UDP-N-acetylmuramate dehydrogenase
MVNKQLEYSVEARSNVSLREYTTIKIGGWAETFFIINSIEDLSNIIKDIGFSFYLLGGGSNLLIKDSNIEKPVIRLGDEFKSIKIKNRSVEVGAGILLSGLLTYAVKNNLGGLENLAGIPATVGGLLAMNASSFGVEISSFLQRVEVMDRKGELVNLDRNQIDFSYRKSSLSNYIILRAWFKLHEDRNVKEKISRFFKMRRENQDFDFPSSGCVFKNTSNISSGLLIDKCGLGGLIRNGAAVSAKHANFIVNLGNATYNDVDYLVKIIKDKVYKKHGVVLEEEIKRWV